METWGGQVNSSAGCQLDPSEYITLKWEQIGQRLFKGLGQEDQEHIKILSASVLRQAGFILTREKQLKLNCRYYGKRDVYNDSWLSIQERKHPG